MLISLKGENLNMRRRIWSPRRKSYFYKQVVGLLLFSVISYVVINKPFRHDENGGGISLTRLTPTDNTTIHANTP